MSSLFDMFNVILLQSERDRHSILNTYWFTSLLTRSPFRHGTDHTKTSLSNDGSTPRNTSASTTDPSRLTTNAQIHDLGYRFPVRFRILD